MIMNVCFIIDEGLSDDSTDSDSDHSSVSSTSDSGRPADRSASHSVVCNVIL